MLRPEVAFNPCNIYLVASNQDDEILHNYQRYWIIEAIHYTHRKAIEELFTDYNPILTNQIRKWVIFTDWLELLLIKYLPLCKAFYYSLSLILENKGIISSIYSIIDIVFTEQLGYNHAEDFSRRLHLIYSDKKTVLLIHIVQKKRQKATLLYDKYNQLLAMPRLFYQHINYMDIIHNIYFRFKHAAIELTLYYNKNYLGCVQGYKSPFYYKKEVVIRAFNTRVIALFYYILLLSVYAA